jgi:hypothetical protein
MRPERAAALGWSDLEGQMRNTDGDLWCWALCMREVCEITIGTVTVEGCATCRTEESSSTATGLLHTYHEEWS